VGVLVDGGEGGGVLVDERVEVGVWEGVAVGDGTQLGVAVGVGNVAVGAVFTLYLATAIRGKKLR
jgi:predicted RecB family endonuclease